VEGLIELERLRGFVSNVFVKLGVRQAESLAAADVLIFADARGISSHGVANLERIYVKRIRSGAIDPAASPRLIREDEATALLDGGSGLGLIVATRAMDLAIKKARAWGVAIVGVRNSSHFGCSSFYSMRALAADMIGIAMTNLGAQVIARPPDGRIKMLGTNPLSISAPAADLPPFSLDMSTTVVSTGRLRSMAQSRRSVPAGWIVDDDDKDATDPSRFFENSAHLQMLGGNGNTGGYKGYGLGLAVDILAGLLTGAQVGPDPRLLEPAGSDQRNENIGHLFLAIDIARFRPVNEFRSAMDRMLGALLHNPARAGGDPVLYPGYPEAVASEQSLLNSVAIAGDDVASLSRLGDELGVTFPEVVWREELSDSLEMRRS